MGLKKHIVLTAEDGRTFWWKKGSEEIIINGTLDKYPNMYQGTLDFPNPTEEKMEKLVNFYLGYQV